MFVQSVTIDTSQHVNRRQKSAKIWNMPRILGVGKEWNRKKLIQVRRWIRLNVPTWCLLSGCPDLAKALLHLYGFLLLVGTLREPPISANILSQKFHVTPEPPFNSKPLAQRLFTYRHKSFVESDPLAPSDRIQIPLIITDMDMRLWSQWVTYGLIRVFCTGVRAS